MESFYIVLFVALATLAIFVVRARIVRHNRHQYPLREIREFLTSEECDHIIDLAKPLITRSSTVREGKTNSASMLRTSGSAFFYNTSDGITERIKRRIAELTETDLRCQEPLQVTHYNKTEYYTPIGTHLVPGGVNSSKPEIGIVR